MKVFYSCALSGISLFMILSAFCFSNVSADDSVVDEVNITVPVSCSLEGTGMTSHNANIVNGTVNSAIGETTMKAFCNDNEGFAIYAIGYTDNTDGKNVLTSSTLGSTHDIATGTATSGANSNWAMKLSTVSSPTPTYPITIQNSFGSFHAVPDDYALVAKRTSATDIGQNAEGSTLKSTYQTFISQTQPAGTYTGQVKYVLVHPNDTDSPVRSDQIVVIYDGNDLTFPGGASTNRVVYGNDCSQMYRGATPTIVKTSNIANDGTRVNNYEGEHVLKTVSLNGADKVQVVVDFGIRYNNTIFVAKGEWDGYDEEGYPSDQYYAIGGYDGENAEAYDDTKSFTISGDTVTLEILGWDGGDYGMYARVYPLYKTEQTGTEETTACSFGPIEGSYTETTVWNDSWDTMSQLSSLSFENEGSIIKYLEDNKESFLGTTVYYYSHFPYNINYNGNNATAGTMNGFQTHLNIKSDSGSLAAPNFYKTNYGFAGWSEEQNATINSNIRIYGPNEKVTGTDLHFDSNTHETTLYAVWVPSAGNLQNWSGCSSLSQGQVTALTDTRDNQTYAIAKLADNNCWIIENLRLNTTNSSDSAKAQGFGGVFTGLANSETSSFSYSTTANSKYSTSNITGDNQVYRIPRYNNSNTNSPVTNMTTTRANIYSYGNYYSWAAAKANTTNFTVQSDSEAANTSICPAGWHLPTGNIAGEYYALNTAVNNNAIDSSASNSFRSYPNNFVYSGYISGSSITSRGSAGSYWTSSVYNATNSYDIRINYSTIYIGSDDSNKFMGYAVRCISNT